MRKHGTLRVVKYSLIGVVALAVVGGIVMVLWNWLLPKLFGVPAIGFWQALGVLLLARILLGGFHGGAAHHSGWRERMLRRWERMTPEEREKLREALRARCGGAVSAEDGSHVSPSA